MDDKTKIRELAEENAKLKEELQVTKEHLKISKGVYQNRK